MAKMASEELQAKVFRDKAEELRRELEIAQIYMELFGKLVNTKFKVRGNRSYLVKDLSCKAIPTTKEKKTEKKEKGPIR